MKKVLLLLMVLGLGVLSPAAVTGLFNTGVDNSSVALAYGVADPHYTLITPTGLTAYAVAEQSPWVVPGNDARWIAPTPFSTTDAAGWYVYELKFNITDIDPSTVSISGKWATDNSGQIWLNGVQKAAMGGTDSAYVGFTNLKNFALTSDFVAGENVLQFKVYNYPQATGNPTGLLVTNLVVPAPGAILLGAMGTGLVGWLRRRRSL